MTLTYRMTLESDRDLLEQWIADDPYHRGTGTSFWFQQPGAACFAVMDDSGVVFFVKAENATDFKQALRLHVQFGAERIRTAKAMMQFIPKIERDAKTRGYKQIVWESVSEPLIRFASRFGYTSVGKENVKTL